MSELMEGNQQDFEWGPVLDTVSNDNDSTIFGSFTYRGVEYSRYDSIYLYRGSAKETDIGKLVKIWRTNVGRKRGKVLWFFRPHDVREYLRDYKPSWNELFLASGDGKGAANIISLETIAGKCSVVCTANDSRNTQPSESTLRKADYFFSHTFNVVRLNISPKFPDMIEKLKVERFFNRGKAKENGESKTDLAAGVQIIDKDKPTHIAKPKKVENSSKGFEQSHQNNAKTIGDCRKGHTSSSSACLTDVRHSLYQNKAPLPVRFPNKRENFEPYTSEAGSQKKRKILAVSEAVYQDERRWFKKLPWEERLKEAHGSGCIVLLVNLDPSYNSSDVEGIVSSAFDLKSRAKIIIRGHCNPIYGEALVIFNTKDDADRVINELQRECLVVGEGRPLVACKFSHIDPSRTSNFPGHLIIDYSARLKGTKRKAVFTSHCTQANTIEHEMAIQWRVHQQKSFLWWKALREEQACEVTNYASKMSKSSQLVEDTDASEEVTPALEPPVDAFHRAAPLPVSD